jgi:hypothetical protein
MSFPSLSLIPIPAHNPSIYSLFSITAMYLHTEIKISPNVGISPVRLRVKKFTAIPTESEYLPLPFIAEVF